MDWRERHIGPITARVGDDGAKVVVDVGALVRRLLLFEHCTLESDGLVEIPRLYNAFGFRDLMELLESGALSIICDHLYGEYRSDSRPQGHQGARQDAATVLVQDRPGLDS
jgi:hypothetical protein